MSALPSPTIMSTAMSSLHEAFAQQPQPAAVLQTVRLRAWHYFASRGFPTIHDENWKYTNLQQLEAREFHLMARDVTRTASAVSTASQDYQVVFVNGHYQAAQSLLPSQPGITIVALSELPADQLAAVLDTRANATCRFVALNTALSQDGVLIELAEQITVAKPIHLIFMWNARADNLMAHPRVVIRAGRHSKLTVIEHYTATEQAACLTNAVTTMALAEGAQLEHCRIQLEATASFHIGMVNAELAAQASLISHQFNLGAALGRCDVNATLAGAEASVAMNGLQFAGNQQHHDTHTLVEHSVPHTRSTEDYRGIADQRGRVVFNGKVRVHEQAVKTDAQQSSRNLLLGPRAEIDAKPELEIYNDDVKCAHGATIGQLDANALFYLRSRGLDEKQARGLLTQAFADVVISRVSLPAVREQLKQAIHERFSSSSVAGLEVSA